MRVSTVY